MNHDTSCQDTTHYSTLRHIVSSYDTLQHAMTHRVKSRHTTARYDTSCQVTTHYSTLRHIVSSHDTLQHATTQHLTNGHRPRLSPLANYRHIGKGLWFPGMHYQFSMELLQISEEFLDPTPWYILLLLHAWRFYPSIYLYIYVHWNMIKVD